MMAIGFGRESNGERAVETIRWHTFDRLSAMDICFSACVSDKNNEKRLENVFLREIG